MPGLFQNLLLRASQQPRRLFLIDGLGALLSAVLLGLVLPQFESLIGMPAESLYLLAAIPAVFAVYDLICLRWAKIRWRPFLQLIAYANLAYCVLSIGIMVHHIQSLTIIGMAYFVGEIIIVMGLSLMELQVAEEQAKAVV